MITAIYPGTFDPITHGHSDIVTRASKIFDKVLFAVANSTSKQTLFDLEERISLAKGVLSSLQNVEVISFDGLITDLAREQNAGAIIRGIRAVSDFDYEFQMAGMNRELLPETETIFLSPAANLSFITSSLVREISAYGGDVGSFVHESVVKALKEKHS
ncbi:MAG: pantetheine-phosphate adenylyltransferase [Proteobacteria bacterium]|nr:pantetheine-phosphate adenylyltransferase [Pseudomonadota bacterium]